MDEKTNIKFEVHEKIENNNRENWNLIIDAVYTANPDKKNLGAEVISKLLGVGNQGGFRFKGAVDEPQLVVLFTSGEDIYWKDEVDKSTGMFIYYGDNKTPGNDLHSTSMHGNEILRNIFKFASSDDFQIRKKVPPVLIFKKYNNEDAITGRDVQFIGLAVPGTDMVAEKDWLTAIWKCNINDERFQNYKAYFTIIDTSKGCEKNPNNAHINLAWLNDIENGKTFESKYAPIAWKYYITEQRINSFFNEPNKIIKSKENQLPNTELKKAMLKCIHDYFIGIDNGYSFEPFAADIIKKIDCNIEEKSLKVTKKYKDGGIDAIGKYRIFSKVENSIYVDFYMQAKCYDFNHGITTDDTKRLIARLRDKQFGILVTTSYIAKQAYEEILADGHPVVFITGKHIIDCIIDNYNIYSTEKLESWLELNYPKKEFKYHLENKKYDTMVAEPDE